MLEEISKYANHFKGVHRMKTPNFELRNDFEKLGFELIIINTEMKGTGREHSHFHIATNKKFPLTKFKEWRNAKYSRESRDWINGEFNFTKSKKPEQSIIYILKESLPAAGDYLGISLSKLRDLQKLSYEKTIPMTKAILNLRDQLLIDRNLCEYIINYRTLRIAYKKPDPYWQKEYERMEEFVKTEEDRKRETEKFICYKTQNYFLD